MSKVRGGVEAGSITAMTTDITNEELEAIQRMLEACRTQYERTGAWAYFEPSSGWAGVRVKEFLERNGIELSREQTL